MSRMSMVFKALATVMDSKRDRKLKARGDIEAHYDIPYADGGKYNLLDVYYPKGTSTKLPVIVSIHGGGYVYGTKKIYTHYGMFLAAQGFTFVNFNYHLAPKYKFPTQLTETNLVMEWMVKHAEEYHIDLNHVFLVGDSAGAQMASQYASIYSNPEYAAKFSFRIPEQLQIRAVALNCGMYDLGKISGSNDTKGLNLNGLLTDYLGSDMAAVSDKMQVMEHITSHFPPAYVMTSYYDFLKNEAKPMYDRLQALGIPCEFKIFGEEGQKYMGHVFHCNMNLKEAEQCNREECEFFRRFLPT